ncbi:hypothetical protein ES703_84240 [subsurface metagenome]
MIAPVGELTSQGQGVVAVGVNWAVVAAKDYAAGPRAGSAGLDHARLRRAAFLACFIVVAAKAVPVEDRLNIPRKVKHIGDTADARNFARRASGGLKRSPAPV